MQVMRVGIIENDVDYREFLLRTISKLDWITVTGTWDSAEKCYSELKANLPDTLLIDIGLPGMTGIELSALLSEEYPDIKKIIITSFQSDNKIFEAFKAGCVGYMAKNEVGQLESTLKVIYEGGAIISPLIALRVMRHFQDNSESSDSQEKTLSSLTPAESRVLQEFTKGMTSVQVAEEVGISVHTVRHHTKSIYKKLEVNNRQAMMRKAWDLGLQ